ncbi:MAG: hypothetical protein ABUS54_01415 [Actinomycetota bacterium]
MGKKRIKQYLMLLLVIGVVSIAAGGGNGTFASFSAETTNSGNYFATGTLVLNDNGGATTCTSAGSNISANQNGTDCDTLFTLPGGAGSSFTYAKTTSNGAVTSGAQTSLTLTTVSGAPIYKYDKLCFVSSPTDCVTATQAAAVGFAGALTVTGTLTNSYSTGAAIVDNSPTSFAKLTLTNAGSLDASGISFKSSAVCNDAYGGGNTTLTGAVTAGNSSTTTLTVASTTGFVAGEPVIVSSGSSPVHAQTFIVSAIASGTQLTVTAQNWNFSYPNGATVAGPRFNGGSPQSLCANLKLTMTETNATQATDLSGALGCAYTVTNTSPVATNACDFSGGKTLSTLPTSLTALTLTATGGSGGNTNSNLAKAGGTRYLVLAVHYTGSNFDNTYQNIKTTTFDLTWHIDQA